jgi:HK97 family phage major capsid protein
MPSTSEITLKRNKIITDATALVQRGLNTSEAKESYRKMLAEADDLESDLEMLNRIERAMPGLQHQSTAPIAPATPIAISLESRKANVNGAWRAYLSGRLDERIPEHRDLLTSASGANGGAIVPTDFAGFVDIAQRYYAPLAQYVRTRETPPMRPVKVSHADDRNAGLQLITEGSTVTEVDPTFSSTTVFQDLLTTGNIRYSNQLLDDAFDLENLLSQLASSRYGRGLEKLLVTGTDVNGTATPNNPGLINIANVAATTSSLASGIGWDDLVNVFDALDPAYLPKAYWMMSSKSRNYLSGLKDGSGRAYFVASPSAEGFDML